MSRAHKHFTPPPCCVLMLTCQGGCMWVTNEGSFWATSYVMTICCRLFDFSTDGGTPQHPPCQLSAVVCSQVHLWHRTHPTLSLRPGTCTGSRRCSTLWTPCYSGWGCLSCLWRRTPPAGNVIKIHEGHFQTHKTSAAHLTGSNNKIRQLCPERITSH